MRQLALTALLLVAALAQALAETTPRAYTVEAVPNVHVADRRLYTADPSGILSPSARDTINAVCARLEQQTGIESAVVLLPSIGDADVFDFAQSLFRHWGVGKKGKDNGVLVLFVADARRIRIHTGYGLEGVLTDAMCKRIQTRYMVPAFRRADWDEGMVQGVRGIYGVLHDSMRPDASSGSGDDTAAIVVLLVMVAAMIGIIFMVGWLRKRCPCCGKPALRPMATEKLRDELGRTIRRTTFVCSNCGNIVKRDEVIDDPNSRGGGNAAATGFILGSMLGGRGGGGSYGGGFGGSFGGGSSGGGGAQSGW